MLKKYLKWLPCLLMAACTCGFTSCSDDDDDDSQENTGTNDNTSGGNTGSNNGGSSTKYEKPDIGFYDYTASTKSLKVQYRIYNKDEAKVSSAKIYYGTSSNPTASRIATVSGVLITANISGLKAGTTYYVKCVATGKGGTTATSTTRCMTLY